MSAIDYVIIPKGSFLYRTQPVVQKTLKARYDDETGKTGLYFATSPNIPFGMMLEYNKQMPLLIYKTTSNIKLLVGKYSHRKLNPSRYGTDRAPKDNDALAKDNKSHIDYLAFPIMSGIDKKLNKLEDLNLWGAETFISTNDLKKLKFSKAESYPIEDVRAYLNNLIY